MNDFSATIEAMKRPDGSIDLDVARCGFTADFCDATAAPGEPIPVPSAPPVLFINQTGFLEQVLRAEAKSRRSKNSLRYEYLTPIDMLKTHAAVEFANSIGHLMNVELTFVPFYIGVTDVAKVEIVFCTLMKRYVAQCARWGVPAIYVGVFERSATYGLHIHVMMSLPDYLHTEFKLWILKTCQALPGMTRYSKRVCHTEVRKAPSVYSQWKWWRYLVKGLCPNSSSQHETERGWISHAFIHEMIGLKLRKPGIVGVKRVRISETISARRQRKAGFLSAWDRGAATPSDWCSDMMYLSKLQDGQHGLKSLSRSPWVVT